MKLDYEMKFKIIVFYLYLLFKFVNDLIFICLFGKLFLIVLL